MATRPVVPRATGEGSIGTAAKHWGNGYFDELNTDLIVPQYGSTNNSVGAADRKWKEGHFEKLVADDVVAKGPVVDVRAFGAKGDGVTDDTAAIQSAINYCLTTHRELHLTADTYNVSSSTLIIDGHDLVIDGCGATLINGYNSGFRLSNNSHDIVIKNIRSNVNYELESHNLYYHIGTGAPDNLNDKFGIYNVKIDNVSFNGGVFGIALNMVKNVIIKNCTFNNITYPKWTAGGYGVLMQSSLNIKIVNCQFIAGSKSRHGVYVSIYPDDAKTDNFRCENVSIVDCLFDNSGLELDENGHYYSPSTLAVMVRDSINTNIDRCIFKNVTGVFGTAPTKRNIYGLKLTNCVVDTPVYNDGESEARQLFGIAGGTYDGNQLNCDCEINNVSVVGQVTNDYTQFAVVSNQAKAIFNNIKFRRLLINMNNATVIANNVLYDSNEYLFRFYGSCDGKVGNIHNLGGSVLAYEDAEATVSDELWNSLFSALKVTTYNATTTFATQINFTRVGKIVQMDIIEPKNLPASNTIVCDIPTWAMPTRNLKGTMLSKDGEDRVDFTLNINDGKLYLNNRTGRTNVVMNLTEVITYITDARLRQ